MNTYLVLVQSALKVNPSWVTVEQRKRLQDALERAKNDREYLGRLIDVKV